MVLYEGFLYRKAKTKLSAVLSTGGVLRPVAKANLRLNFCFRIR